MTITTILIMHAAMRIAGHMAVSINQHAFNRIVGAVPLLGGVSLLLQ